MGYARPYPASPARAQVRIDFSVDDRGGVESQKYLSSVVFTLGAMAIVRLAFKLTDGCNVIDLARAMSITERRMIHQKQVFTVMGGHLADGSLDSESGGDTPIKISTAPNNFYTRNAVSRGFRAWKKNRAKALEASGENAKEIVAKYSDFKVILDGSDYNTFRTPVDAATQTISSGEWLYSTIKSENPDVVETALMIVGPHTGTRYSLAQGWLQTRANVLPEPQMPDLNSDGTLDYQVDLLATMFQDTIEDTDRLDAIANKNDRAPFNVAGLMTNGTNGSGTPYSSSEPRNLQLQYFCNLKNDDLNVSIPGFQALCGLVRVDVGSDYSNPVLILDVETKGWNF